VDGVCALLSESVNMDEANPLNWSSHTLSGTTCQTTQGPEDPAYVDCVKDGTYDAKYFFSARDILIEPDRITIVGQTLVDVQDDRPTLWTLDLSNDE
jgi:hypothetical protein